MLSAAASASFLGPYPGRFHLFQVFQILPWEKHQLSDNKTRCEHLLLDLGNGPMGASQSCQTSQSVPGKEINP